MSNKHQLVNSWIFLNEDEPKGTTYHSPNSCYQRLIKKNIYQAVDLLFICFVTIKPTGSDTFPQGDGTSYTIDMEPVSHKGTTLTNRDYMKLVNEDGKRSNPNLSVAVTLEYGKGNLINDIFSIAKFTPEENATNFAKNLVAYLKHHGLNGFDFDWEWPLSTNTTQSNTALLINAIGTEFKNQTDKFYLTVSPATTDNLDPTAVNSQVDFINLQLYFSTSLNTTFKAAGFNEDLFAYGAKFESWYQGANNDYPGSINGHAYMQEGAFKDNNANYSYPIYTSWRINSDNFEFEQDQQQELYHLVFPKQAHN